MIHDMKPPGSGDATTKKRKQPRNTTSGKFDATDPHADPELMDQLVRMVRAIQELEPFLAASVLAFTQTGDKLSAGMASMVGGYIATLKDAALRDLAADPESLKDAKKRRLEAQRLGNMPLEEVQRVQQRAADWLATGEVTPRQLAQAHPQVLQALMLAVARVGLSADSGGPAIERLMEVVALDKPQEGGQ